VLVDVLVMLLIALLSFGLAYLGASVGLVLGQLRLPALVFWLNSPTMGAATSLAISTVAGLVGAVRHTWSGRVKVRLLLSVGVPSAVAAYVTARYAASLDPDLVEAAIGATLTLASISMLVRSDRETPMEIEAPRAHPRMVLEVLVGATLGAVAGIVGLMMGTLRLPLMLRLGAEPAEAIGTNMAIGCITGLFAGVATFMAGSIDWLSFGMVTPATMLGAHLGASATGRLDKQTLRTLIAWTLLLVGVWMLASGSLGL